MLFFHRIIIVKRQDKGWAAELSGADLVEDIIRRNTEDKGNNA